jgi:hypothetical protein
VDAAAAQRHALAIQRLLNLHGLELVILPVMLRENGSDHPEIAPKPA